MKRIYNLGIASILAMGNSAPFSDNYDAPKPRKASRKYPHSSNRQNARYARQLAGGKLVFTDGSHLEFGDN